MGMRGGNSRVAALVAGLVYSLAFICAVPKPVYASICSRNCITNDPIISGYLMLRIPVVAMAELSPTNSTKAVRIADLAPYIDILGIADDKRTAALDHFGVRGQDNLTSIEIFSLRREIVEVFLVAWGIFHDPRDIMRGKISRIPNTCVSNDGKSNSAASEIWVQPHWFDSNICTLQNFSVFLLPLGGNDSGVPKSICRSLEKQSENSNRYGCESRDDYPETIKGFFDFNEQEWQKAIGGAVFMLGIWIGFAYFITAADTGKKTNSE